MTWGARDTGTWSRINAFRGSPGRLQLLLRLGRLLTVGMPNGGTLKIHFLSFCEHLVAPAASCTAGVVMFVTCLQDFPCDKLVTGFTFHPKEPLVVLFTVGRAVLADVLPGENLPTGLAFKAPQVPLLLQGQQRLPVLDVPSTASTIAGAGGFFRAGRHWLRTQLTEAVSPIERDSVSGWKRALADSTRKAVGMIGLAQGSDHLSFHELPTAMAACPIHPLVVQGAEILAVLYEEAPLCQVTAAHFAGETFYVEMFGLDPKHFTLAWLPTFMAVNDRLLRWVVRVLRVRHLFCLHPTKL